MKKLFNEYLYQQAQEERIEAHLIQEADRRIPYQDSLTGEANFAYS